MATPGGHYNPCCDGDCPRVISSAGTGLPGGKHIIRPCLVTTTIGLRRDHRLFHVQVSAWAGAAYRGTRHGRAQIASASI
jgi:hypothetical protein